MFQIPSLIVLSVLTSTSAVAPALTQGLSPAQETDQEGGQPPEDEPLVESRTPLQQEFDRHHLAWQHAIFDFTKDRRDAIRRGAKPDEMPIHPAPQFFPRFEDLAQRGCIEAWVWMSEQFWAGFEGDMIPTMGNRIYKYLVDHFADDPMMLAVADNLLEHGKELGFPEAIAHAERLSNESELPEVQAKALDTMARLLIRNAKHTGERIPGQVRELWTIIVDGYPGTEVAKDAAGRLFNRTEVELQQAYEEWATALEAAYANGESSESWPPFPAHQFLQTYTPLSYANFVPATAWIETFYRPLAQIERSDRVEALNYFTQSLSNRYLPSKKEWMALKFRFLKLLLVNHPDAVWMPELLADFAKKASAFQAEDLIPLFEPLADGEQASPNEEIRAHAVYFLAESYRTVPTWEAYQKATRYYERLREEFPTSTFATRAQLALGRAGHVAIGQPARQLESKDQNEEAFALKDYRGDVVILHFGGFWNEQWVEQIKPIKRLLRKYEGKRLSAISITTDYLDKRNMRKKARQEKLNWRYIMEYYRNSAMMTDWDILAFPTVIVIDAEGVIRSRNLPWEETEQLVEKLVAEAHAKHGPKPQ